MFADPSEKKRLFNRILTNKKYEAEVHCSHLYLTRKNIFCAHFAKNVLVTLGNDSKQFHVAQTRMCTLFLLYNTITMLHSEAGRGKPGTDISLTCVAPGCGLRVSSV